MDISLDQTEKVISLILGGISIFGILLRKWFIPKVKYIFDSAIYWFTVPKRLRVLELFVRDNTIKTLNKSVPELHSLLYIIKHKCDFLLKDFNIPMYECNANGDCVWANNAFLELFGLTDTEIKGNGWMGALHPDDIKSANDAWKSSVRDSIPYKFRYRVINQETNQIICCETTSSPIYDENKDILSYLGKVEILKNITPLTKESTE